MTKRLVYRCYVCQSDALIGIGCSIAPGDDYAGDDFQITAEWLMCLDCGENIRVDLRTGQIVVRAAYVPETVSARKTLHDVAAMVPK